MKKLLLIPIFAILCAFARIDSAYAIDYPFSVTTSATNLFEFYLSAYGTFYVDCGTGGTLSSDNSTASAMISGGTINKTDTTKYTFKCWYSDSAIRTIRFGGTATNYNTGTMTAAISFYTDDALITSISGNLSTIFPYISGNTATGAQPRFCQTFKDANITSIPDTLFSGYTVASTSMFYNTFANCTGLASIPENLFFPNATSVSGAQLMFSSTFNGCTGLTSIPANLFSKITSGAQNMFQATFNGCTGLTSIPENLFFPNATSVSGAQSMFQTTFYNCTGLTSIPENLFSKITSGASNMFSGTFLGCTGLASIPANLFSKITSGAQNMFVSTFQNCTGLTSIPENLFSKITSGASNMFNGTFYGCSNLTGYIPPTLFDGLIKNNAATITFGNTFRNTGMWTSCTSGTPYATDYTSAWGGKVSCLVSINMTFDGASPMSCNFGSTFVPPTPAARPGYVFTGWKAKPKNCGIPSLDPSIAGTAFGLKSEDWTENASNYGLTTDNTWATEFSYGTVWGMSICSDTPGTSFAGVGPQTLETASRWGYCWCKVTGFTASGNDYTSGPQCTAASSSWVFRADYGSLSECAVCTYSCVTLVWDNGSYGVTFRTAAYGAVGQ